MGLNSKLDSRTRPDLKPTHYLDNRIYTDPNIFESEMKNIYEAGWKFICHASEIKKIGDFKLVRVANHELIAVRNEQGKIRCFFNACAHRGAKVMRRPAGNLKNNSMTCFYHLWRYDLDGGCVSIPQAKGYENAGISRSEVGLRQVRVETIFDLVFVCLDADAISLDEYFGDELKDAIRTPFGSADLEVFHIHRTAVKANWKLFVETNCEGYHELLHVLNRTTGVALTEYRKRRWRTQKGGHVVLEQAEIGYDRLNFSNRDEKVLPGMSPNGHIVIDIFPDMMLNCRSTVVRIDALIPINPELTILECRGLGLANDSDEDRAMRIRHHNEVWGPTGTNLAEDIWAVESQMENMRAESSRYSVIAREEKGPLDDEPLRSFYNEWSERTGYAISDASLKSECR